ncbi:MAG: methylase [Hydrogenophilales bacterium 28-61-23]|nr:MAG: methylase [Hydrogenophilales bacterium 28-61-23]
MKPYAESSEQNRAPIQAVLEDVFADRKMVLEIASGTGQHAVYFGQALPHLTWQTSELPDNHAGIQAWLDEAGLANVLPPVVIDVNDAPWPVEPVDAIFNANTVHIVAWPAVERMFAGIGRVLAVGGILCLYGPFNYGGQFTSESNARFDVWLKGRDPASGVRDFEAINRLAEAQGLTLVKDIAMPSNNRTLVWQRTLEPR